MISIDKKQIYINGEPTHVKKEICTGDTISVDISFYEESENIVATKMDAIRQKKNPDGGSGGGGKK